MNVTGQEGGVGSVASPHGDGFTVMVSNIPESPNETWFRTHFAYIGKVTHVKILPCREGQDKTVGYVRYTNETDCRRAIAGLNNKVFEGSPLRVTMNRSGQEDSWNNRVGVFRNGLRVFNIPGSTEEETLKSYFASIGEVTAVRILPCREGRDTTLGFVYYTREVDCGRAVEELDNMDFSGFKLRVQQANLRGGDAV